MFNIQLYSDPEKKKWDDFISGAKNSLFLFKRDFMEYHSDRFEDNSLMIYEENKLMAILPANKKDDVLYSHQGLTFGGLIFNDDLKVEKACNLVFDLKEYLREQGLSALVYKAIPYIYHSKPADEDIFALQKNEAEIINRDITSVIDLSNPGRFAKGKRGSVKKAKGESITISESQNLEEYFSMIEKLLEEKYATKPVHNYDEMNSLQAKFPENIKLFTAHKDSQLLAGVLVFEGDTTVKTQYISSIAEGREMGAVDLIIDHLVNEKYTDKKYFDFGSSRADEDWGFNPSLMQQKELFGARAVACDIYKLNTQ